MVALHSQRSLWLSADPEDHQGAAAQAQEASEVEEAVEEVVEVGEGEVVGEGVLLVEEAVGEENQSTTAPDLLSNKKGELKLLIVGFFMLIISQRQGPEL